VGVVGLFYEYVGQFHGCCRALLCVMQGTFIGVVGLFWAYLQLAQPEHLDLDLRLDHLDGLEQRSKC